MRKDNIKVLHVIAGLGNGGAERQLFEMLRKNKSHVLCSLTDTGVYSKSIKKLGINFIELKIKYYISILLKIPKLLKIIKEHDINVIHAWMYNSCLISIILKVLIVNKRISILWGIRCSNMNTKYYSLQLKINIFLCNIFSKLADKIIYNSYAGLYYHNRIGFNSKKAMVIQNGIDNKKFRFSSSARKILKKKYNILNEEKVLLCVARVDPMKGHSNLLKAFSIVVKHNRKLKLILIGKDTQKLNKNNNIITLGMIKDIENYYSVADFIILPSLFGEGFSNVLVEGMLCKLFPISSDVGDNKLIVGKTGIIFPSDNIKSIINILEKVANMKQKKISIMSQQAYIRAKSEFNLKKMFNAYKKTYEELV